MVPTEIDCNVVAVLQMSLCNDIIGICLNIVLEQDFQCWNQDADLRYSTINLHESGNMTADSPIKFSS